MLTTASNPSKEDQNQLLQQARQLIDEKKYEEVLDLLPDELLQTCQSAELYAEKARSFGLLNQFDDALENINITINIDPNYSKAYNTRGRAWHMKKEYDKALNDYNKAIELDPRFHVVFNNRGLLWFDKKEYDKALNDYNKAIELDPSYLHAYNNRGRVWFYKKEYDKALNDYNKSIELDPSYHHAYNNRGNIWLDKKEYDKALNDYNKALELDPSYYTAYNNRSRVWLNEKEYDLAILDCNKAIELNQKYPTAYNNRGLAWFNKEEYKKALNDFNKAIELDPEYNSAKYWRDLTQAKLGESIQPEETTPDVTLYFVEKTIANLEERPKILIRKACAGIIEIVDKIRNHAFTLPNEPVAHYTKLRVADILVSDKQSKFRYYNVIYMNDPEEGEVLLQCLKDEAITTCFRNGQEKADNNIYIGSFLPVTRKDDLVMWRTYGKDENNVEAAGCCIIVDAAFFDKDTRYLHPDMRTVEKENAPDNNAVIFGQVLSKVMYYNRTSCDFVGDDTNKVQLLMAELTGALHTLISLKNTVNKENTINAAIDKIVYRCLSELRYLFKSADYYFEGELRVIQYVPAKDDKVIIDPGNGLPKKLFIESVKSVQPFIKGITLGPKVPNREQWMYLEVAMHKNGQQIEVRPSGCRFQ